MTSSVEEKEIREMLQRMARIETKMDLFIIRAEEIDKLENELSFLKDIAVRAENKADLANSRADRADKLLFTLGGTTATTIVVAIMNLIIN